MKKILVPTDLSANSKTGIRFAIQLAAVQKIELIFVHVLHIPRLSSWSDNYYENFAIQEETMAKDKLEKFIKSVYSGMRQEPGKHSFVICQGMSADICLLDYCRNHPEIDMICIGTRGAGTLKKVFGTNTGNLITKSTIPVLSVPPDYRKKDLKTILYATDLRNFNEEVDKVLEFAKPFEAKVEILHVAWPDEVMINAASVEASIKRKFKFGVSFQWVETNATKSLVQNIQQQVKERNPSLVIMFTEQKRNFLQKLFMSSKSEALSFQASVPLLVFNKG